VLTGGAGHDATTKGLTDFQMTEVHPHDADCPWQGASGQTRQLREKLSFLAAERRRTLGVHLDDAEQRRGFDCEG
jgi:hypothetical protein